MGALHQELVTAAPPVHLAETRRHQAVEGWLVLGTLLLTLVLLVVLLCCVCRDCWYRTAQIELRSNPTT